MKRAQIAGSLLFTAFLLFQCSGPTFDPYLPPDSQPNPQQKPVDVYGSGDDDSSTPIL